MDESILSSNTDNSLISRETESNSIISTSFEAQSPISQNLKNHIINAIVANLKDIIEENNQNGRNKYIYRDKVFYLENIPPITLDKYIRHLVKYTGLNISTLILSVIYIDNFCEKFKYTLSYNNIYRLILTTIYISLKYNEDVFIKSKAYAEVAGVSLEDLNNLEYQMCIALDFVFYVSSDYYQQYFVYFSKFSSEGM
jgi:hypothetical protein